MELSYWWEHGKKKNKKKKNKLAVWKVFVDTVVIKSAD